VGGVAERSMAAVLKTALASGERGFESHPLRQALVRDGMAQIHARCIGAGVAVASKKVVEAWV
jgi:hypothetical protein